MSISFSPLDLSLLKIILEIKTGFPKTKLSETLDRVNKILKEIPEDERNVAIKNLSQIILKAIEQQRCTYIFKKKSWFKIHGSIEIVHFS